MELLGYPLALVTRQFSFTRSTMSEDSAVARWNSVMTTDFLCTFQLPWYTTTLLEEICGRHVHSSTR